MNTVEVLKIAIEASESGRPGACVEILKSLLGAIEAELTTDAFAQVCDAVDSDILIDTAQVVAFSVEDRKRAIQYESPSIA